jgi:hypothetical protein
VLVPVNGGDRIDSGSGEGKPGERQPSR